MPEVVIGQYRVTGLIGQGGMGAVYAAEHALLGRPAAIKVLLPDLSQKQDIVLRFFNEARAATAIRHPGIIEIYDFGWTPEGAAFIVMEYLEGETLGRRLARGGFRWQAALAIARQIAGALAAAHGKGIVHRDLKPDNIFLVPDPEVPGGERIKLLDFGIAKLAGDTSPTMNVTRTGAVMGTPTYMSPEQCRGVAVDHRADLYALGCVVFELCSGRPPFVGEGTGDVLAAHIHVPVPSLASLGIEVPRAVEDLVQQLLAKSPAQRMPNAETVIRAIDALTAERASAPVMTSSGGRPPTASPSVTTLSGSAVTSRPISTSRTPRRGRWIAVVAAAVVTLVSVVAVVATLGHGDDATKVVPYAAVSHPTAALPGPPPVAATPPARGEPRNPPVHEEPPPPGPPREDPGAQTAPATSATQPPHAPVEPTPPPSVEMKAEREASVEVTVDSVPAGAQILLAGAVLGKTPFHGTLPRREGDVTLMLRLAGYLDRSVVVHADQPINQHIKLVRPTLTRPPRTNRDQSVNPFGD